MAENIVYQTEKLLKEQGDKVPEDKKKQVDTAIEDIKTAIKSEDTEEMKAKMDALNTVMQTISADLYSQAKSEPGTEPGPDQGAQPEGESR